MATFGTLKEFCPASDSITTYLQRAKLYFTANKVPQELQVAILLTSIGASTYDRLCDLLAPDDPSTRTLKQISELLKSHFEPPRIEIAERFHFRKREQAPGEPIVEYDAALRKLATHCNFGANLETELRDQIVCGLQQESVQRQLLTKADLTYKKTMEMVKAAESAEKSARSLRTTTAPVDQVNLLPRSGALQDQKKECYRCGGNHLAVDCRFKLAICHFCKKRGHIARACMAKSKSSRGKQTHTIQEDWEEPVESTAPVEIYDLYHVQGKNRCPYMIQVVLNGAPLQMEVDTGASMSLISESTYLNLWEVSPKLQPTTIKLRTYSGQQLTILGALEVIVEYGEQRIMRSLLVVEGAGPSLLGRDWLEQIRLDWKSFAVQHVSSGITLEDLLSKHEPLFRSELGKARNITAAFHLEQQVTPRFCNARTVPYALGEKIEVELERLQKEGIIEPVPFSEWAAPIVPVMKQDGTVRICGDYKLTVNKVSKTDSYPIPRIEDLFARVAGGQKFTKLDIAHAYQQIPLQEESKMYVTINTHKGLFRYNRLPFGVSSAPAIFQRAMETLLKDIPGTVVYIDDILVTGKDDKDHVKNLDAVMTRLEAEGFTLKKSKCEFLLPRVEYLAHTITASGLQPSRRKTEAITNAPAPQNISQLRSFLGMINYYGKFLKNLSCQLAPLYNLLKKQSDWKWGVVEAKAFELVKKQLAEAPVLQHYDPTKAVSLSTDASPYGVGAVLCHVLADGTEKPIAYASRTLNAVERKYSQLDKEAMAIVFGVKRFHQYLYGRQFAIVSDHKPLQYLLSESRGVPVMASARLQRWALILGAYQYTISYRPGEKMANADGLSRLPLPESPASAEVPLPGEVVCLLQTLQSSPITAEQIRQWTTKDPILSRVRELVAKGWNENSDEQLAPYQKKKDELSLLDGCILRGNRVVVPAAGRARVLDLLHDGHPGIVKMKSIARQVVWWPGIDADLTSKVQQCEACQVNQKSPAVAPLHCWEWPKKPWSRIHVDHAGPFQGKTILVVIDAHSKWIEAVIVPSTSSAATIKVLRNLFATHGIPELLFSDNGTSFTSEEFSDFVLRNGIRHRTSSPYHPATNGLAERAVQVVKAGLRKTPEGDMDLRLARLLFKYRNTPHATTGVSPSELLLGRKPRTHLDLLHPDLTKRVEERQIAQKVAHDGSRKERLFQRGDNVYARNFQAGDKWFPGKIVEVLGSRSYKIKISSGASVRRHVDHIKSRAAREQELEDLLVPELEEAADADLPGNSEPELEAVATQPVAIRRSSRIRRPPERFQPVWS